jgi:hypothetical protein
MTTLQKPTCATCGSENILAESDAYATWDRNAQCWVLDTVTGFYCPDCDDCSGVTYIEDTQP